MNRSEAKKLKIIIFINTVSNKRNFKNCNNPTKINAIFKCTLFRKEY